MADQHTPSKPEAKKAEKEADQVVAAFSQALDSAFEAEVEYIVGALRQNRDLTHCLSGMLKSDALQALLDGRLRAGQLDTSSGAQPQPNARGPGITKLRSATIRFEHLKTQPTVVLRLFCARSCLNTSQQARAHRLVCYVGLICPSFPLS